MWFICLMARHRIRIHWAFSEQPKQSGSCAGSFSSYFKTRANIVSHLCWTTIRSGRGPWFFIFPRRSLHYSPMQYRRLGDAGVKLSEIGLGGWLTVGNAINFETAAAVMNKSYDLGIN